MKMIYQVRRVIETDFVWELEKSELSACNDDDDDVGGARGVMFIVVGNRTGDPSANDGHVYLHFTFVQIPFGMA